MSSHYSLAYNHNYYYFIYRRLFFTFYFYRHHSRLVIITSLMGYNFNTLLKEYNTLLLN